jgi:DNA-binding NarL/FixJ family response regulator
VLQRLVARAAIARASEVGRPQPGLALTPRERDVLSYVVKGLSNGDIAEQVHLGVTTVKTHVANLMHKVGSPTRVHLAVFAVRHELIGD